MEINIDYILLGWWKFCYWSGNILGYLIIPLVQGYVMAGEFTKIQKVHRSILINIPIFLMYFVSFIALLFLLYFIDQKQNSNHKILSNQGIIAVTIALCFAGGFFLLILFMGWGIVRIPIDTWIESNLQAKLNRILFKVAGYEEKIIRQQNKVQVLFNIAKEIKVEEEI